LPMSKCDGDPGRIRTCNPQSRNLMLYPVELRDRLVRVESLEAVPPSKR
jgi:hypothetical protein